MATLARTAPLDAPPVDGGLTELPLSAEYDDTGRGEVVSFSSTNRGLLDSILTARATSAAGITITTTAGDPLHMQIATELVNKYPLIAIDNEIFGEPRLANHRFGVSDVLSSLCVYNSFDAVIEKHGNRYTEEELKDAVRFARDFLDGFYASDEDDS